MPALAPRRRRPLGRTNWLLLAEALPALALASLAIKLLPFRRVAAASTWGRGRTEADERFLRKASWAVNAWGRRVPWRAVCFQMGLALHWMLRRRGIDSRLHYGVATDEAKGLAAHVWVSVDGRILIGGDEAPRFACLATFPAAEPLPGAGTTE